MDRNLKIVEVNPAFIALSGREAPELLGSHPWHFFDDQTRLFLAENRKALIRKDQRHFRAGLVRPDGVIVPVTVHGSTLKDTCGASTGHFVFLSDLTEHHSILEMAFAVQRSLLPTTPPQVQGLRIAARFVPSDVVSGDYYDFFIPPGSEHTLHALVGDISGHGVDAGLLMATARGLLRMRAKLPGGLQDIIRDVNASLYDDFSEAARFMTLFYCILDTRQWTLSWIRAGHDQPMLRRADTRRLERLGGHGLPLGVNPDSCYEVMNTGLLPGDLLLMFSDGLREAESVTREGTRLFGWKGLEDVLNACGEQAPEQVINRMCQSMREFTGYKPLRDDVTVLAIKRE